MEKRLIGWARKDAGRPLEHSSDVITNVSDSTAWERRKWQGSG